MVSKLILGTVQFGLDYGINNQLGLPSEEVVNQILQNAYNAGIIRLDTAASYGESEARIGKFIKANYPFNIITKFKKDGADWRESLESSLRKMNVPKVEVAMFHSFEDYKRNIDNLQSIIEVGKGRLFEKIGVSVYTNEEISELIHTENVDVVQVPYNLLDNESQRGHLLKSLKSEGKIIHTRSCFLQGLFFMDEERLQDQMIPLKKYLHDIRGICKKHSIQTGHLAIQYPLSKNYIDGVLFGVDTIQQLEQNLKWASDVIDDNVVEEVDQLFVSEINLLNPSKW